MQKQLSRPMDLGEIAARYISEFELVYNRNPIPMDERGLRDQLQSYAESAAKNNYYMPPGVPVL
jgi:hypothetical protein